MKLNIKNNLLFLLMSALVMLAGLASVPKASAANLVQSSGLSQGGSVSITANLSPTAAGDVIVVCLNTASQLSTGVTDNKANTYVQAARVTNGSSEVSVYYAYGTAGGVTAVTANFGYSSANMIVAEYSGIASSSPVDQVSGSDNGWKTGSAWTSGTAPATTQANDVLVGCAGDHYFNATSFSAGTNFSSRRKQGNLFLEDQAVSSTGSFAASGGITPPSADYEILATLVSFKSAGANPLSAPAIASFAVSPASITAGQSTTLSWNVSGNPAPMITLDNALGTIAGNSVSVSPATTTTYTLTATNSQGTVSSQTTVTVAPPAQPDMQPPSVPADLSASAMSATQINLSWSPSTDNVAIAGYRIYRGGVQVGTSATTNYSDSGLSAGTNYSYTVAAYDAAGNVSGQSTSATATTLANPPPFSGGSTGGLLLMYESAKAGPNHGWENSASKGAAITVWGRNFGSSRGNSYVTVAGVALMSASDYAEWGVTTNPTTAKGLQRITFWLNHSMPAGNTAGITITVNGVTSNALPFTIDNTGAAEIRFIDPVNGSESNNGQYAAQGSGSNGPWKYPFQCTSARPGIAPGAFIYLRGGTYTNIQAAAWHYPRGGCNGAGEETSSGWLWYYPTQDGTDALRITMTEYPGEHAHFFNAYIESYSSYWTFTNFTMDGDLTYNPNNIYFAMVFGAEEDYCANNTHRTYGDQMIGVAMVGNIHIGAQVWGINHNLFANYINNIPTQQGLGPDHSYNLYIGSSDNVNIQNNELHGGSRYNVQIYDETRNCIPLYSDSGRGIANLNFDSNLVDMNAAAVNPLTKYYGVLAGMAWPTGFMNNITVKNNIIYINDGSNNAYQAGVNIYQESAIASITSFHIYNNTISGMQYGVYTMQANNTTVNGVDIKNNIFANIPGQQWYTESAGRITPTWDYNLTDAPFTYNVPVTNGGHNKVGNPQFINSAAADFHVQATSAALDSGTTLPSVGLDFDSLLRPQGTAYDMGALEYASGYSPPATDTQSPSIPSGLSATAVSATQINLSWSPSTDNVAIAGYRIYRGGVQVGTSATTNYSDIGLSAGTNYSYTVAAYDAAGNISGKSAASSATTLTNPDTTDPTVVITNPTSGTVSETVNVAAAASDPVVAGQTTSGLMLLTVYIDGNVFASSTTGTISKPLDSTTLTNASHTITAVARDNAGNVSATASVSIIVNNAPATKYPRLIALTSLEGLTAVPATSTITATILSGNTILETQSNLSAVAGNYKVSFAPTDPQLVDIRITIPNYLSARLTGVDTTVQNAAALPIPQLLAGDVNNDNIINSLDYSILNSHWNQGFVAVDFNRDSMVNSLDYAILKNNWGKNGQ